MAVRSSAQAGTFYRQQSTITDPGDEAALLADLPADPAALGRIVQGLLIHYQEGPMYGIELPAERREELETRDVASMLRRIRALDGRPLAEPRPPERRLIGCCRDFATLFTALMRATGIATRVRFGYALYFQPDFGCDHVIAEYWNEAQQRWILVDPQMDELHCHDSQVRFDPLDVPRDQFQVAGAVWQRCRRGEADPDCFGVDQSLRGLWHIQSYLLHDLAALNRVELLCWDCWGLADVGPEDAAGPDELAVLDHIAALSVDPTDFDAVRAAYATVPGAAVSGPLRSYSPNGFREAQLPAALSSGRR